eukprot:scaffold24629_cov71-Skeletonema_dohrnii-CCMP3373.AAC.1
MPDMPDIFAKASSDTVTNLQLLSVLSDMHNPIVATMATARESHPCGSELVYVRRMEERVGELRSSHCDRTMCPTQQAFVCMFVDCTYVVCLVVLLCCLWASSYATSPESSVRFGMRSELVRKSHRHPKNQHYACTAQAKHKQKKGKSESDDRIGAGAGMK